MRTAEELNSMFELRAGVLYRKSTGRPSCVENRPHRRSNVYGKGKERYYDHHIVWVMIGRPPVKAIDHIDGNPANNDPSNLREATQAQNLRNRRISSHNTSGVKGVYWNKRIGKWHARVTVDGSVHHLGYHEDLEAADLIATLAREKYHGEFARHS